MAKKSEKLSLPLLIIGGVVWLVNKLYQEILSIDYKSFPIIALIIWGVISLLILFITSPKTDRRFKTGYKNNQINNSGQNVKIFSKWYGIIGGVVWVVLLGINLIGTSNSQPHVPIYLKPDKTSMVIGQTNDTTVYTELGTTIYFTHVRFIRNDTTLFGYVLKNHKLQTIPHVPDH